MNMWIGLFLLLLCVLVASIFICYQWISIVSNPYLFNDPHDLPQHTTILLLGTARMTKGGKKNLFFSYRIEKAAEVYHLHKIQIILLSGADKISQPEDEVEDMFRELTHKAVSSSDILKDKKGIRTYTSIWRCKHIYKEVTPVIVSQKFHNQRALFIAMHMGMHPVGVNAKMVQGKAGFRIILREALARVKCILDCYFVPPHID